MRILLTTVSLDAERGGGTAERTRRLARHLALAGEKVCVLSIDDGSLVEALRNDGADVHVTRLARRKPAIPVLPLRKLWSLVRRSDVIHILGYWNFLSISTAAFARWSRTPYVLSPAGEFAGLANPRPAYRLFHKILGLPMIRGAARIISITDLERQQIIGRFGRSPMDVITIPNGIENDPGLEGAISEGLLPDAPFILFVGRLASIKGPDILLAAFEACAERFPEVVLVLAGPDAGLGSRLKASARSSALRTRIRFTGFLNEEQRTEAYRRAAFLVVPSRSEAMSLVAVEAGSLGIPLVVTSECGLDVVSEIGGGEVCEASIEGVGAALVRMLEVDSAERGAMGRRWQAYVTENYRWEPITRKLIDVFHSVLR